MSLTSHISRADSPVRTFFVDRLPHTGSVVRDAAAALRGAHVSAPLAAAPGVNPGRAGTAVDYLVRFALAPDPCPRHASGRAGAGMLRPAMAVSAVAAIDEALALVAKIAAFRRAATDDQWSDLARISLVLATFEAVYRSGLPPAVVDELPQPPAGWRGWAEVICTDIELEDIAILGWAAAEDHRDVRGRQLICNPTFSQSRALGGADADLITDTGLLIELKSTSTTRVCSRSDVWQLCGYALADTEDTLGITSVGLSALRWRSQVTWPLEALLCQLADAAVDVAALRQEFATMLAAPMPVSRRSSRAQRARRQPD